MTTKPPSAETLDRLAAITGPKGIIREPADMAPYLSEERQRWRGKAAAVLKPASTEQVSRLMAIAFETGTKIVPQGGNTGLVGGQIPFETGDEIVLSLSRINKILDVDADNNTLSAEAGCLLATIQHAASDAGRLFPLSLAAEGTCQIGGNLASNAGGTGVLRYGTARELVLGLEVVLADGRVWNGMRALRKDNTGYDLKQIFLGSEGTLGIITGAVLKIFAKPRARATAFIGVQSLQNAIDFFHLANDISGQQLTACELIPEIAITFLIRHNLAKKSPLANTHPWYLLIELTSGGDQASLLETVQTLLAAALEKNLIADATLAANASQTRELWALRENISDVQKQEGGSIKHDITLPLSALPAFLTQASQAVTQLIPGARPVPFGHLGEGNIHFNISQPVGGDKQAYLDRTAEINRLVHDMVMRYQGSISAEHGIGRLKVTEMQTYKSQTEIELMQALKRTFDPKNILNPGKTVPGQPPSG